MSEHRLLAGPDLNTGPEWYAAHLARLGPLPAGGAHLVQTLERSELRGRGGASFPVAAKWRTVAQHARGNAVVLANGAEGEPLSHKDRVLMRLRPHLVLDGALLAASSVGAKQIHLYVGEHHVDAVDALQRAAGERLDSGGVQLVPAPARYVAGEESAAVHSINEGLALPTPIPPRPFERGVGGRPTLVQNVESLAHAALLARTPRSAGALSVLLTVSGHGGPPTVVELAQGTPLGAAVHAAGGDVTRHAALLLGGYFGSWVDAREAASLPLDAAALRLGNRALGAGVIALLQPQECGLGAAAQVARHLASESAQQCGPCVFGLRSIADVLTRVAACDAEPHELTRLRTWAREVRGRGACRHPDGAAAMVLSALDLFEAEAVSHAYQRICSFGAVPAAPSMWSTSGPVPLPPPVALPGAAGAPSW